MQGSFNWRGTSVLHPKQKGGYHMSRVLAFLKDESGATAIEYGLIAAGISVVIIATVNTIGSTLNSKFTSISTQLK
jgi:pilus assembly protein Flp/PilA